MRKFTASSQQLRPDPTYNSKLVSKFVNCLMIGGKKSTAQRVFYDAMDIIAKRIGDLRLTIDDSKSKIEDKKSKITELEIFEKAVNNVKPMIEVRSKRIGGASYQVPM